MMVLLRNSLLALFLGLLSGLAARVIYFLDQAAVVLGDVQAVVAAAGPPLIGAAHELRGAAQEQRRYYKATGKALFIATRDFARMVQHTDARLEKISDNINMALVNLDNRGGGLADGARSVEGHAVDLLAATHRQVEDAGYKAGLALAAARGNLENLERLGPSLVRSAANLEAASASMAHSTESLKLALEPLRKPTGRLKFIVRWLLGLPRISIPR